MTKEEIIDMARVAGWDAHHAEFDTRIEAFARLIAEHERETCALFCEEKRIEARLYSTPTQSNWLAKKI